MTQNEDAALFDILRRVSTDSIAGVLLAMGLPNQWVRGPMPMRMDFPRTVGRAFTMRFVPLREDIAGALPRKLPVNRDAVEVMRLIEAIERVGEGTIEIE